MAANLWPDELKILVIDDDQTVLTLIRLSLEPAGFRVLRTNKPTEGLDLALREQPDLLILDIMMPDLDGLEILRRIRRHPKIGKIPAIIISAQVQSVAKKNILQRFENPAEVIDAYLSKPFDPGQLLKIVKQVLLKHKDYLLEKKGTPQNSLLKQRIL
jgi:CheY-like chemotaxis protein